MKAETINIDFKDIPKNVLLNNIPYNGDVAFINGYNGYTKTNDDAMMCALINNSAFNNGKPNYLTDTQGNLIHSEGRRGQNFKV